MYYNYLGMKMSLVTNVKYHIFDKSCKDIDHCYNRTEYPESVEKNISYVKEFLNIKDLIILNQIHSNLSFVVDQIPFIRKDGDGLTTSIQDIGLGILTADCMPILFWDEKTQVIGATHAGWRGSRNGVIESTLQNMIKLGAHSEDITALIGPSIHQNSYEVSQEFLDDFLMEDPNHSEFFINSTKDGHYMFDLPSYGKHKLKQNAVGKILHIEQDSFSNPELYPSYRRDYLAGVINNNLYKRIKQNILSVIYLQSK